MAGRHRDFGDVQDILFMQDDLDEPYLQQWASALGVSERLEKALNEANED